MTPANVITIETPKKVLLNGLWFGPSFAKASKGRPEKAKRVIVWVHGLSSTVFSKHEIMHLLTDNDTAVLAFNNRGHDKITRIVQKGKKILAGGAHEVFTDCVDDIQGAVNFAKKHGAKEIFLAGHSTGSQKIVYYTSRKPDRAVKGLVLMVPLSDYAGMKKELGQARLSRAEKIARQLVWTKKPHELLPASLWPMVDDAQRFLSLYTPDSMEQSIFSYFNSKPSRVFRSIKLPLLGVFAGADEYADRPAEDIAAWFNTEARAPLRTEIIAESGHGFSGHEAGLTAVIRAWLPRL